jgi:hypothetical protein
VNKKSRAERSAAKNVIDAKRRGWRGRSKSRTRARSKSRRKKATKKGKEREQEYDAASSVAWTDITTFSRGSALTNGQNHGLRDPGGKKRIGKCVVM